MDTPSSAPVRQSDGRLLVALGLGLALLGIVAYMVQVAAMHHLVTPWYAPIATTLGVVLLLIAMRRKRRVWRILALLFVGLVAGLEWIFVFVGLPPYTGPVAEGRPFPKFQSVRADGTRFTERDLQGDANSVLVFFRGRW
jgi:hypothetical protein